MINYMDLAHSTFKMVQSMKDSGKKIKNTEKAQKHGQTEKNTKDNINKVCDMDKVTSHGQMEVLINELLFKTILKVMEYITGLIRENIQVNGQKIK